MGIGPSRGPAAGASGAASPGHQPVIHSGLRSSRARAAITARSAQSSSVWGSAAAALPLPGAVPAVRRLSMRPTVPAAPSSRSGGRRSGTASAGTRMIIMSYVRPERVAAAHRPRRLPAPHRVKRDLWCYGTFNECGADMETGSGGRANPGRGGRVKAGTQGRFRRRDLSGALPPGCRGIVPFRRLFTHLLSAARVRGVPGFAVRVLARWVFAGRVLVDGQEPDSPPQRDDTGEFEVSTPDEQVGALNGQGGGDVAATGADPASLPRLIPSSRALRSNTMDRPSWRVATR